MTAPAANGQMVAQSTIAIESQASTVAGTNLAAQTAVGAYLTTVGQDEEAWYDHAAITAMARDLARLTDGFTASAARSMDAFMSDAVANLTGRRFRAIGVRNTVGSAGERSVRPGVTTAGLFGRAADTYRYQQSLIDKQFIADVAAGAPSPTELASPLDVAVDRARRAAGTNLQLAMRNQGHAVLAEAAKRDLVTGYRRVLHAELSEEGSCGLCIAASTAIYRTDKLMPMHPGCHCLPVPIFGGRDPGGAINDRDLARFYGDAGGTSAEELRQTRYKVDEHGELGPVLRPHGDPIRTAEQARRDSRNPRPKSDEQKLRTLRAKRDKLERAYRIMVPKADASWTGRLDFVSGRIGQLDREIVRLGG